jgi:hypothetical protein
MLIGRKIIMKQNETTSATPIDFPAQDKTSHQYPEIYFGCGITFKPSGTTYHSSRKRHSEIRLLHSLYYAKFRIAANSQA